MKNKFPISKFLNFLILSAALAPAAFAYDDYDYDYDYDEFDIAAFFHSQHLDENRRHPFSLGVSFSPETEFEQYGTADIGELAAEFRVLRLDKILYGNFDLWVFARGTAFLNNPDMTNLPDVLLQAGVDLGMWWRFDNGWSWEIRTAPGIYSDIASPAFGAPLTLNSYFCADPTLSFQIGATFRQNWKNIIMPNLGVAWQPVEEIRIEAGIPRSKITLFNNYYISPFATFEWRNDTYTLSGKGDVPHELTYEEIALTAGVAVSPMLAWSLTAEYGVYLHRQISASVKENTTVEMSKNNFFRFMFKSEF